MRNEPRSISSTIALAAGRPSQKEHYRKGLDYPYAIARRHLAGQGMEFIKAYSSNESRQHHFEVDLQDDLVGVVDILPESAWLHDSRQIGICEASIRSFSFVPVIFLHGRYTRSCQKSCATMIRSVGAGLEVCTLWIRSRCFLRISGSVRIRRHPESAKQKDSSVQSYQKFRVDFLYCTLICVLAWSEPHLLPDKLYGKIATNIPIGLRGERSRREKRGMIR